MFIEEVLMVFPDLPRPQGIFRIQNVAEYVYADEREIIDESKDVFNFYLPFERTWMEFKMPPITNTEGKILPLESAHSRWGILAQNKFEPKREGGILQLSFFTDFFRRHGIMDKIRFNGESLTRFDRSNRYIPFDAEKGHEIQLHINTEAMTVSAQELLIHAKEYGQAGISMLVTGGSAAVVFMFLNFIACKNVHATRNDIPPKLLKKKQKEGKPYFEKFYTLEIDPMKEILRREGDIEHTGLKKALHICRGHFATYDEKGLFGKYKGTFWRPAHVRGSAEIGKIHKNYEMGKINEGKIHQAE